MNNILLTYKMDFNFSCNIKNLISFYNNYYKQKKRKNYGF